MNNKNEGVNSSLGGVMRMVASCSQCGEEREIAGGGLCFKCYRQQERADDPWGRPDRHATQIKKAQRKGRKCLMAIMAALEDLEDCALVPVETIAAIRKLIKPEVDRIGSALADEADPEKDSFTTIEIIPTERKH